MKRQVKRKQQQKMSINYNDWKRRTKVKKKKIEMFTNDRERESDRIKRQLRENDT